MPPLILTQTPTGPRYVLDGRELRTGDLIELIDVQVYRRGAFAWTGDVRDPPRIISTGCGGQIAPGADVQLAAVQPVVRIDRPHPEKPGREMSEYERRVLRHQAKPPLPPAEDLLT